MSFLEEAIAISSDEEEQEEWGVHAHPTPTTQEIIDVASDDEEELSASDGEDNIMTCQRKRGLDESHKEKAHPPRYKTITKKRRLPADENNKSDHTQKNKNKQRVPPSDATEADETTTPEEREEEESCLFRLPPGFRASTNLAESKSLLFCCVPDVHGVSMRIPWAYHRFVYLKQHRPRQLLREILHCSSKYGYPIHSLLHLTTNTLLLPASSNNNDNNQQCNPAPLIRAILQFAASSSSSSSSEEYKAMLQMKSTSAHIFVTHPSHAGRTALHMACWGNVNRHILRLLVKGNPHALLQQDDGGRTPLAVLKMYHFQQKQQPTPFHQRRQAFLESATEQWLAKQQRKRKRRTER
ncbi:expressed unknown protein [Seminavis robusta]|uniref:Uncharacterized protein n=1 Tax=Seminavis robusta TaxID=568900 RepID=A0A9N8HP55_9STRA|nr:expressed unknown protein [Seminavis robusta]|eukprot:Sro1290_g259830.1 n/a (354) ;mRNA; f:23542-24603